MRWALLAIVWAVCLFGQAMAADRPNVLLICVDDLKPALSCYGDEIVKSPNIDRLAARGVRFERAYCNQAVCSPSRKALLVGLRPQSLGIYDLATNFRTAVPDAVTLPQYFKNHGYRTEAVGKIFHPGHGNHDDASSWSVPHWRPRVPTYALQENRAPTGLTREEARLETVPGPPPERLPRGAPYESADVPDTAYPDGRIADEAVRRLQQAVQSPGTPYFLAVGFLKPHLPFCAPQKYWDFYEPASFEIASRQTPPQDAPAFAPTNWGELRQYSGIPDTGDLSAEQQRKLIHGYYAAISYMDAQLGRVLDVLVATGLDKTTIVMLWGDHGWHLGDHGMWCKHTNYEQAARIPFIVVAPGVTPPDATSASLVESVDIYPTLCELAALPTPKGLDGASFAAALRDPSSATKDAILHVYPRGNRIGRAVRTARYRLVEWKRPGASADTAVLELYDYERDPEETANLAARQPEVVAELRQLLAKQPEAKPQLAPRAARRRSRGTASRAEEQSKP